MLRFHVTPLPKLDTLIGKNGNLLAFNDRLLAFNDRGDILLSGDFGPGVYGMRYNAISGRTIPLRHSPLTVNDRAWVRGMNNRGEVVGGHWGGSGGEFYGVFWDAAGRWDPYTHQGPMIAINDRGQTLVNGTWLNDGQTYGFYYVGHVPPRPRVSQGKLVLANSPPSPYPIPGSLNNKGAVVARSGYLWEPGRYSEGRVVEVANADNAGTPFDRGEPLITDDGVIVCLGSTPQPGPPESLRFHRWRSGASSTSVRLRLPEDSTFRSVSDGCTLTTVAANSRGEVLLTLKKGPLNELQTEPLLWRANTGFHRLPGIDYGLLMNNRGWILGVSLASPRQTAPTAPDEERHFCLLRPF